MILDYTIARCLGAPAGPQGLHVRPECYTCQRRTAPRAGVEMQKFVVTPTEFPCSLRLPAEESNN